MKGGKSDQAARCIKSRIITNVINYVLSIDTFEQKCVMFKVMFKSPRTKDHVQTIGIDPSLSNNAIYANKYLENIKKLYKQAGKCDNQKKFKDIIEAAMVSIPEEFTDNSPISPMTSSPVKKPSTRKSLFILNKILDANKKTDYRRVGAAKSKRKAIKYGNTPWSLKQKKKGIPKSMNR